MRWAIALALEAAGNTSPNPMVGAVVVKGGRVIGEGYHSQAGTPHAEVHALRQAGSRAAGADLYVTLEPCSHRGRTPPCVDAILDAGIKRVFIGTRDPNPLVNGRGVRKLKRAGVEVVEGILEESCREINEAYNKFITDGMPLVTAKVALTFDGKLATADGSSRWITNQECRRYVHHLRSASDAVMVGAGTVRADDPRLDVRIPGFDGPGPKAVVVDEKLGIKRSAKLFEREEGDVIFATTRRAPLSKRGWIKEQGMDVITCRADSAGHVSLTNMLKELGRMGITSILLEGGGRLFAQFFKKGLVDRVVICMAPKLFGGRGKDFLPSLSIENMNDALSIHDISTKTFGDNIVIEGRLK